MRTCATMSLLMIGLVAGCFRDSGEVVDDPSAGPKPPSAAVVWLEEDIAHEDVVIDLGYRQRPAGDAQSIEPVAKITRDGKPVADAMVFHSLVSAGDGEPFDDEAATVYEVSPEGDATFYAQGRLEPPAGAAECMVRFRIVLSGRQQPWTGDVTVPTK